MGLVYGEARLEPVSDPFEVDAAEFCMWKPHCAASASWRLLKSTRWGETSARSPGASAGDVDAPVP